MIKLLEGFPRSTVALECSGHVTRADYARVLIPRVNEVLAREGKVRVYYEIGSSFSGMDAGAVWEDFKAGMEHLSRWERVAVVTDVPWIRSTLQAFRLFLPGKLRLFGTAEAGEARDWITAPGERPVRS